MVEEGDRQTPSLAVRGRPPSPPHRHRNWFGKSPRNSNGSDPSCSQTQPPTDTVAAPSLFALP